MKKLTKNYQAALDNMPKEPQAILEAVKAVKANSKAKFDGTMEVAFKLNLDPTQAEQQLRGSMVLPNGTGRDQKVLVIANPEQMKAAEAAGADYVGDEEMIQKIKTENWFDFDVLIATPDMMPKIGQIGQILGPKGLMPNPKTGTVTPDVAKAVTETKSGKVVYRIDKQGNLHFIFGKTSFEDSKLAENLQTIIDEVTRIKPSTAKGQYIQNVAISSTMSPSVKLELAK